VPGSVGFEVYNDQFHVRKRSKFIQRERIHVLACSLPQYSRARDTVQQTYQGVTGRTQNPNFPAVSPPVLTNIMPLVVY
jgi:hypothetical protein